MYNYFKHSLVWHPHAKLILETHVLNICKESNEQGLTFYIPYFFNTFNFIQ